MSLLEESMDDLMLWLFFSPGQNRKREWQWRFLFETLLCFSCVEGVELGGREYWIAGQ